MGLAVAAHQGITDKGIIVPCPCFSDSFGPEACEDTPTAQPRPLLAGRYGWMLSSSFTSPLVGHVGSQEIHFGKRCQLHRMARYGSLALAWLCIWHAAHKTNSREIGVPMHRAGWDPQRIPTHVLASLLQFWGVPPCLLVLVKHTALVCRLRSACTLASAH